MTIFLVRGILIFIAWQLIYHLWFQKIGEPDNFLTNITARHTANVLGWLYRNVTVTPDAFKATISIAGERIIGIAAPCNALEIYVLYIAFLFCFPSGFGRRFLFTAIGIPLIYIANILRCVIITWMSISHKNWVDISHHYVFTTIVYLLVFWLWMLFTKKGLTNEH